MIRITCVVLVLLVAPLGMLAIIVLREPASWRAWTEWERVAVLAGQSASLAGLTVLLALPVGTLLGVAMGRLPLVGGQLLRLLLLLSLFLPLPVTAIAWQIILSSWFPPLAMDPGTIAWRPWNQGLIPAAIVHAVAAIPWVAWLMAIRLRTTDRNLEEMAWLESGPRGVLGRVWLPRLRLAILLAAVGIIVQTLTEIVITDLMMVRTFAEETYTQIVTAPIRGYPSPPVGMGAGPPSGAGNATGGVAAAIALTLPVGVVLVGGVAVLLGRFAQQDRPTASVGPPLELPLPIRTRGLLSLMAWLVVLLVAVAPLAALVWKAGHNSTGWRATHLFTQLARVPRVHGVTLSGSILSAAGVGLLAGALAFAAGWAVRQSPRGQRLLALLALMLAVTPGPLIGFGLKEFIEQLLNLEEALIGGGGPVRAVLYDQPSPVPGGWASLLRLFPLALAILVPSLRAIPPELHDQAAVDGLPAGRWVGWPLLQPATLAAMVAVAVLALGEVAASKIVTPPQWSVYILELFNQMHYGPESAVAALALVQVALTGLGVALLVKVTQPSA